MPQPRTGVSPSGGHCPVDSPKKTSDSAEMWDRAWPQTQRELEALVDAYLDRLVRYACSRLKNLQDAEDVVQEVFVRCLADRPQRQDVGMIGPYLYRSVANACIDVVRKRNSGVVARDDTGVESVPDRNCSPSDAIEPATSCRRPPAPSRPWPSTARLPTTKCTPWSIAWFRQSNILKATPEIADVCGGHWQRTCDRGGRS